MQEWRSGGDLDDLADFADLERGIDARALLYVNRDIGAGEVLKPCFSTSIRYWPGNKLTNVNSPSAAAGLRALFLGAQVRQGHVGIRNRSSRAIGNRAGDRAVSALSIKRGRSGNNEGDRE